MIINKEKLDEYFGTSHGLENTVRDEKISLALFYNLFPNLPKYETLVISEEILDFENALMEQLKFLNDNENIKDGKVNNILSYSVEGYSASFGADNDVTSSNQMKRLSTNAYNYLANHAWVFMGVNCD